jgi:hypothetical protein
MEIHLKMCTAMPQSPNCQKTILLYSSTADKYNNTINSGKQIVSPSPPEKWWHWNNQLHLYCSWGGRHNWTETGGSRSRGNIKYQQLMLGWRIQDQLEPGACKNWY